MADGATPYIYNIDGNDVVKRDASDGTEVWRHTGTSPSSVGVSPSGDVYYSDYETVYKLDSSGTQQWTFIRDSGSDTWTLLSFGFHDGNVIVGGNNGAFSGSNQAFVKLDPSDGSKLDEKDTGTGGNINEIQIRANDGIYTKAGQYNAKFGFNFNEVWSVTDDYGYAATDNGVYYTNENGNEVSRYSLGGLENWSQAGDFDGSPAGRQLTADNNFHVYFDADDSGDYDYAQYGRYDDNGSGLDHVWTNSQPDGQPDALKTGPDYLYVQTQDGSGNNQFKQVAADGTVEWTQTVPGEIGDLYLQPEPNNTAPTADFTYSKSSGTVDFTDASSDPDGSISSWSWDFGDGNTSTSQSPSHTYSSSGTYTVTLTVTDDAGATDTTSQDVTVSNTVGGTAAVTDQKSSPSLSGGPTAAATGAITDQGQTTSTSGGAEAAGTGALTDAKGSLSLSGTVLLSGGLTGLTDGESTITITDRTVAGTQADDLYYRLNGDTAVYRAVAQDGSNVEVFVDTGDSHYAVTPTAAGDVYAWRDTSSGDQLVKYASTGSVVWTQNMNVDGIGLGESHLYVTVSDEVRKLDGSGAQQWSWTNPDGGLGSLAVDQDEGVFTYRSGTVYKIDPTGSKEWDYSNYPDYTIPITHLATDGTNAFVLVGQTNKTYADNDVKLSKLAPDGTEVWRTDVSNETNDMDIDPRGYVYLTKYYSTEVVKIDGSDGSQVNSVSLPTTGTETECTAVSVDNADYLYVGRRDADAIFGYDYAFQEIWSGSYNNTIDHITTPRPNIPPQTRWSLPGYGLDADFVDESTDIDGTPSAWSWDFGDGSGSTQQNPTHTYSSEGTYTVSLTVTDNDGAAETFTKDVTVSKVVGGTLTFTDAKNTLSLAGTPIPGGTAAVESLGETLSATGGAVASSSLALTDGKDGYAAAGNVLASASLGVTDNASTLAAEGAPSVGGTTSITDLKQLLALVGSVLTGGTSATTSKGEALALTGDVRAAGAGGLTDKGVALALAGGPTAGGTAALTDQLQTVTAAGDILASGTSTLTSTGETIAIVGDVYSGGTGSMAFSDAKSVLTATGQAIAGGTSAITDGKHSLSSGGAVLLSGTANAEDQGQSLSSAGDVLASGSGGFTDAQTLIVIDGSVLSSGGSTLTLVDGLQALTIEGGPVAGGTTSLTDEASLIASEGGAIAGSTLALTDQKSVLTAGALALGGGSLRVTNPPNTVEGSGDILTSGQLSTEDVLSTLTLTIYVGRKPDGISIGLSSTINLESSFQSS